MKDFSVIAVGLLAGVLGFLLFLSGEFFLSIVFFVVFLCFIYYAAKNIA